MASKAANKRVRISSPGHFPRLVLIIAPQLTKEYVAMQREPPPFIWAAPDEKNILNCTLCCLNLSRLTDLISECRELLDREFLVVWRTISTDLTLQPLSVALPIHPSKEASTTGF